MKGELTSKLLKFLSCLASNGDPYKIAGRIVKTVKEA
jgi:hypothetical protein